MVFKVAGALAFGAVALMAVISLVNFVVLKQPKDAVAALSLAISACAGLLLTWRYLPRMIAGDALGQAPLRALICAVVALAGLVGAALSQRFLRG